VRLFATLRKYLPPGGDGTAAPVDVPPDASVIDVVRQLGIPDAMVHLVLVDGRHEPDRRRSLAEGCVLSIWPPIAGG
jgi:hypothetical protein